MVFSSFTQKVFIIPLCGSKHVPSNLNDTGGVTQVNAAIDPSITGLTIAVAFKACTSKATLVRAHVIRDVKWRNEVSIRARLVI